LYNNAAKLMQALEQKFPNGGWKKYVRIATDKDCIEFPNYRNVVSKITTEDKNQTEGKSH
jgi:hypothetical protein